MKRLRIGHTALASTEQYFGQNFLENNRILDTIGTLLTKAAVKLFTSPEVAQAFASCSCCNYQQCCAPDCNITTTACPSGAGGCWSYCNMGDIWRSCDYYEGSTFCICDAYLHDGPC